MRKRPSLPGVCEPQRACPEYFRLVRHPSVHVRRRNVDPIPEYSRGCVKTGSAGASGLSSQTVSTRFGVIGVISASPAPVRVRNTLSDVTNGSTEHERLAVTAPDATNARPAILASRVRLDASHSWICGTSAFPWRISVQDDDSSFVAWSKYRPSVHSSAWVAVTTAVPADPVNPDRNLRLCTHTRDRQFPRDDTHSNTAPRRREQRTRTGARPRTARYRRRRPGRPSPGAAQSAAHRELATSSPPARRTAFGKYPRAPPRHAVSCCDEPTDAVPKLPARGATYPGMQLVRLMGSQA